LSLEWVGKGQNLPPLIGVHRKEKQRQGTLLTGVLTKKQANLQVERRTMAVKKRPPQDMETATFSIGM
jgi:hypothetical protein